MSGVKGFVKFHATKNWCEKSLQQVPLKALPSIAPRVVPPSGITHFFLSFLKEIFCPTLAILELQRLPQNPEPGAVMPQPFQL